VSIVKAGPGNLYACNEDGEWEFIGTADAGYWEITYVRAASLPDEESLH
jgi:hypothetical protein